MRERKTQKQTIEIPKGTGKAGFLLAIESILDLPRVQDVHIDARGKVSYSRYAHDEEESALLQIDFDSVMPHSIIRNSEVAELVVPEVGAPAVIFEMFTAVANEQLFPLAFVSGVNTLVWEWVRRSTAGGPRLHPTNTLFGVPVYADRKIEDYMLILCAGHARNVALASTQKSYKIVIPTWKETL